MLQFKVAGHRPQMPVIAVVNRKGGSGKSTLATHLAAYCAHKGLPVLLGDADFQQSSHAWLRQRDKQRLAPAPKIAGWSVDPRNILRAPPGVTHVVLDTPGGLKGYDLLRVVMLADAVLMPVCHSLFDRESAAECLVELMAHPRVASGRCKVAAVGMRIDTRTKGETSLRAWADALNLPFLGALRETQTYVKCLEHGLTLFDMPAAKVETDLAQWQPILDWFEPLLQPAQPEVKPVRRGTRPVLPPGSLPSGRLRPASAPESRWPAEQALAQAAAAAWAAPVEATAAVEPRAAEAATAEAVTAVAATAEAASAVAATAVAEPVAVVTPSAAAPRAPVMPTGVPRSSSKTAAVDAVASEPPKIHRLVPASVEDDLDSRFGGLTTRIGRWLESLSLKRAR